MTIDELATLLRTSPSTIYHLRAEGRGPRAIKLSRRLLFLRSDVTAWLDAHTEPQRIE